MPQNSALQHHTVAQSFTQTKPNSRYALKRWVFGMLRSIISPFTTNAAIAKNGVMTGKNEKTPAQWPGLSISFIVIGLATFTHICIVVVLAVVIVCRVNIGGQVKEAFGVANVALVFDFFLFFHNVRRVRQAEGF